MYQGLNFSQSILSNFSIYKFQEKIIIDIVKRIMSEQYSYENDIYTKNKKRNDVIILKSITGSGKTVMLIKVLDILMELKRNNNMNNMNIIWASNSAELNKQSMNKFWNNSGSNYFSSYFDDFNMYEINEQVNKLEDNTIGFINTQKLGKNTNLNKESEFNGYKNFFDTLSNLKQENLKILIIDECHNGVNEDGILYKIKENYKPDVIIAASATPLKFKEYFDNYLTTNYTKKEFKTNLEDVKKAGIIKDNIILLKESVLTQDYSSSLTKIVVEDYFVIKNMWDKYKNINSTELNENINIQKDPIILVQVEDKFEDNINDFTKLVLDIIKFSNGEISIDNIYHTLISKKQPIELLNPEKSLIKYIDASKIDSEKKLKVIIFKKNLQEGWDCPRAEILYSIRPVKSGKDIAQILGRVLRNPFKKNIIDEEFIDLMSVYFYAPYYDNNLLKDISSEINDKINIQEKNSQIKKEIYSFEIDEEFINKINNKNLPISDKEQMKSPYIVLMNILSERKERNRIFDIARRIINIVSYSITSDNVKTTISDSLNKTKVKIEDFFNESYNSKVEKSEARSKVLDDIEFKYKKSIRGIELLDNEDPQNSTLFHELENLYDENKLINEFNIIKKFYPEATEVQLIKIFWLTAIEHNSIKKIINDEFKNEINLLTKYSNVVKKDTDNKKEFSFYMEKNINKEFNPNNISIIKAEKSALKYDKDKTIINFDSDLELKVINYLNKNLNSWIRNFTDSKSFKISYIFEEEVHSFYPDFLGFDLDDNFTIIETKAKAFEDHIIKLKAILNYCSKIDNCSLIWIIQHKKSYKKLNIQKIKDDINILNPDNLLNYCDDLPL